MSTRPIGGNRTPGVHEPGEAVGGGDGLGPDPLPRAGPRGLGRPIAHDRVRHRWLAARRYRSPRGDLLTTGACALGRHPTPSARPRCEAGPNSGVTTVYASWNGATDVASWQVAAGSKHDHLRPLGIARRQGFETVIPLHRELRYASVTALDRRLVTGCGAAPSSSSNRRRGRRVPWSDFPLLVPISGRIDRKQP